MRLPSSFKLENSLLVECKSNKVDATLLVVDIVKSEIKISCVITSAVVINADSVPV